MDKFINKYLEKVIVFLLVWVILQDFVLAIGYNVTKVKPIFVFLLLLKDILLIICFISLLVHEFLKLKSEKIRLDKFVAKLYKERDYIVLIYIAYFFICFIYSIVALFTKTSLTNILASLRGLIIVPMSIYIGSKININKNVKGFLNKKYFYLMVGVAAFGIIDYYLIPISFWRYVVNIGGFIGDIKGKPGYLVDNLTGNFFGDYGRGYMSTRRLVSFYGNPLTLSYFLVLGIFYFMHSFLESKKIKDLIAFSIIFLAIYLSHTRAIVIQVLIIIMLYLFYSIPKKYKNLILSIYGGVFLILAFNISKIIRILNDGSTYGHIINVIGAIKNISIIGKGLGSFGAWASIGTEDIYLTILGQVGIVGLCVFIGLWLIYFIKAIKIQENLEYKDKIIFKMIITSTIVYFITGFISEQLLAFTTIMPYWFYLGYILNKANLKNENNI